MTDAPADPRGGVLVIDKPAGMTSHDVVACLRRALRTRQVGHAGTLDPMATGVLVVAIDQATKLVPWLTADDKLYEATVRLGVTTDSLDADGRVTEEAPLPAELDASLASLASFASTGADERTHDGTQDLPPLLARALDAERARTSQMPPAVSAIRVDGERAHAIARRGEVPALTERPVAVHHLSLVGCEPGATPSLRVRVEAAKGYFVRALARDLAAALGTVGHLTHLRRLRSGAFALEAASPLDAPTDGDRAADRDAHRAAQGARLRAAMIPLDHAATMALPSAVLDADAVLAASHGKRLDATALGHAPTRPGWPGPGGGPPGWPSAWLDQEGRLVAVGELTPDGHARVLRGFPR